MNSLNPYYDLQVSNQAGQQILGHSNLNTTAVYLQFSGQEAKAILKERGLI
jgi:site-specific recombinase XerD